MAQNVPSMWTGDETMWKWGANYDIRGRFNRPEYGTTFVFFFGVYLSFTVIHLGWVSPSELLLVDRQLEN